MTTLFTEIFWERLWGIVGYKRHCGWYRIPDTVGKIESNIPTLPDNVQTRCYGYNIVGDFGDG